MFSLISSKVFERLKTIDARTSTRSFDYRLEKLKMVTANRSPLNILGSIDTQMQISGVTIPITLHVVDNLAFDVILGMDMLRQTSSVINFGNNTLSIYDGLIEVPMMRALNAATVYTVCNVRIAPMSQAVLQVKAPRLNLNADFVIEGDTYASHRTLLVAKSLVNPGKGMLHCLVLNPTDKAVRLRADTPLGSLHAITAATQLNLNSDESHKKEDVIVTHDEMKRTLEAKGLSFNDTAAKGEDFVKLIELLYHYRDLMADSLLDLHPEGANVPPYKIDTGNALPVRQKTYKLSPADKQEVDNQVQDMLRAGIIVQSDSPFINPLVVVNKASGEKRVCVDFRKINSISRLTSFPLPTMSDVIDQMAQQRPIVFTSLDLKSGYWQIPLDKSTSDRTAFMTSSGVYQFQRLAFGLAGAVNAFCERMLGILGKMANTFCSVYLDDIVVMSRSHDEMLSNLKQVFDRFRSARLKINGKKCHFSTNRIVYLGHIFEEGTVTPNTTKFKIIEEFPSCKTVKQVRRFLGLTGFFRRFIKNYSQIAAPLCFLLRKGVKFIWSDACEDAFKQLKTALITKPVLQLPDHKKSFHIFCDASKSGIGYWLAQKHSSGALLPVSYGGRSLTAAEKNYSISELECLSLVMSLKEFRHLISNQCVTYVYTDHVSLSFLKKMPLSSNTRLIRWSMYLQDYNLEIIYKKRCVNDTCGCHLENRLVSRSYDRHATYR